MKKSGTASIAASPRGGEISHEEARLTAERKHQADAGGPFVSHERAVEWLRSLTTDDKLPRPKPKA